MGMLYSNSAQNQILELEDSDTEDNFNQFEPVLSRAEEALIKAKKTERSGTDYFESVANEEVYKSLSKLTPAEIKQEAINTVKGIADVTPVIGEIKAAYELPDDLSYAFELIESGYDQGDLRKMGLGGAFSVLSAMGIIPLVKYGAKPAKTAVKSFAETFDDELVKSGKSVKVEAPEGLDIQKAKKEATTSELTNAIQLQSKIQNNEISHNQIEQLLKKHKPSYTSVDVEDIFTELSGKNIKVVGYDFEVDGGDLIPKSTTGKLTNAMEQLAKTQDNEITNNQISEILNKGKPNWTSVDLEDSFSEMSIKNINVVDSLKPSSQYGSTKGFENIDAKTPYQVKTKYLDKSKGIENIDEITKILNDQDKGITSPSAIKALASKQNNEVSKQQLFHILEHYKDAPLDDADYKATMKYFQNTEGVKIVDDAPPINGKVIQKKSDTSNVIGGTFAKIDVDMTPDQKFLVDKIREKKSTVRNFMDRFKQGSFNENETDLINRINTIDFTGKKFDMRNKADQIAIAKLLPKSIRRTMIQEMNRPMPRIFHGSAGVSQPYEGYKGTVYRDTTRAEVLEAEGFSPFTDFEEGVELGIGGSKGASGKHAELGKKMLSTSRDPLVSIKRAFGDLVPANVVSAPFPRSKVRGMTREEYTAPRDKAQYMQDETALGLPRTRHKEAEIAFSTPEELKNIRQLSQKTDRLEHSVGREELKNLGKMSLEDRIIVGQQFANEVRDDISNFYTRMNTDLEAHLENQGVGYVGDLKKGSGGAKVVSAAYEDLRNLMKDLQALGQFTEQYGARGTYDSLLQTLFSESDRTVDKLKKFLPEGEKRQNVHALSQVFEQMKAKMYQTDTGKSSLRGVSDKKLKEMMKDNTFINNPQKMPKTSYEDLKRMVFLLTDKFNRGGLMARR